MERYRHGAGVVTYLARYLRGGPIKTARLVAWDGEHVTFSYRTRSAETDGGKPAPQRMTLPVAYATTSQRLDKLTMPILQI